MKKKIEGYMSESSAATAAKRMKEFGVYTPGQQCCPIMLPPSIGGYGFWTAHSVYGGAEKGTILLPGKVVVEPGTELWDVIFGL